MDYCFLISCARLETAQDQLPYESIEWGWLERLPFFQAWIKLIADENNN